ncbi:MAG TPA: DoxX family membrane protein [Terriglobales bacterium]|nr:DoxX family membrane protein [Terriglobales bacterium]
MLHFNPYFLDASLLLMRAGVAIVFCYAGLSHLRNAAASARDMGMSVGFTRLLGVAEAAGGAAVGVGLLTQVAALGLVVIMLGAIYKRAFYWKLGFWGRNEDTNDGWHYDLMFLAMNLVIAATDGGRFVLRP